MPNYQQFQGYANPVGNFFAGQEAGGQRAATQFDQRQKLEVQNALVQQAQAGGSPVQSYPQLQAMQMQAKQMMDVFGPTIQAALDAKNPEMIGRLAKVLENSNNPVLKSTSEILRSVKFHDNDKMKFSYKFEDKDAYDRAIAAVPSMANVIPANQVAFNTWYDMESIGNPMAGGRVTEGRPRVSDTKPEKPADEKQLRMKSLREEGTAKGLSGLELDKFVVEGVEAQRAKETSQTKEQLIARALRGDKEAQKILDAMEARDLKIARAGKELSREFAGMGLSPQQTDALGRAVDRGDLDPYRVNRRTGPMLADIELAFPGTNFNQLSNDQAADRASQVKQQVNVDFMTSFIENIGKQVARVEYLTKEMEALPRFDMRILNVPLRAARMRIKGTAYENKLSLYIQEISTETAKVAGGATSSVAEPSVSARQKWEKIHDENLSIREMLSLLKETHESGIIRLRTVTDQLEKTRGRKPTGDEGPRQSFAPGQNFAPAGTKIKTKEGKVLISDGKGGWK